MKKTWAVVILMAIFLLFSWWIHIRLYKARFNAFVFYSIGYFAFAYVLFDIAHRLDYYFIGRGINFEFGHAEEELVATFFLCSMIAVANIVAVLFRRSVRGDKLP